MQRIIIATILVWALGQIPLYAQLHNQGAYVKIQSGVYVKSSLDIINAAGGTLTNNGTVTNTGSMTNNGMLTGGGTTVNSGTTTMGPTAVIAPGSSAGTYNVTGDFSLGSGKYECELGGTTAGTAYDVLTISGAATFSSATLDVALINGFTPVLGNTFTIMNTGSGTGPFAATNLPALSGGNTWAIHYNSNSIVMEVMAPLPIELISFYAFKNNTVVDLEWRTASERDNEGFEVQRSRDGQAWEAIGSVPSQGDSDAERSYRFTDTKPYRQNYYRLLQSDYDGSATFSQVVFVEMEAEHGIAISPNPTGGYLSVATTGHMDSPINLMLFDLSGKLMLEKVSASNHTELDMTNLPAGIYLLKVWSVGQVHTFKVIKN